MFAAVVTVNEEFPDVEIAAGTKEAVAPVGNPFAERLTVSENPFKALMETAYGTLPPCTTERDEGETETPKSGAGLTVTFLVGGLGSVKFALSVTVRVAV